ncbi:23S rRNA (guanosine-2'-O-)-methyltransferase RlmB [Borrelia miyamotoi]|uniref:tRNA (guanosine(18)-2'-O)-methyltransferase n=1 Tax=Borrelia miyamotoi TaxID=47466 RepID=A0AAP9CGE6_9SPIR|nr:RNA methyltransferase [Borrelia miyamotoi]ATQ15124.1 RNA methyltransferase [Borrelia miyamotoi]ATQ16306.1 RNA methyltransferase [Borrelia miyamotoi]ATQ17450.1 RNA methyltransferase [Borrelia miyamotoi]ATQ18048.1 RNA methyltransferase [Borrelia miyamotoi]ATQ19946.1 RNA methyltransferase [Borrelia miyamotoi]
MNSDILKRIEILSEFITKQRRDRIDEVLSNRTNYLTLVLEDIFQPQNASAAIRTIEILGLSNIHIIETNNKYILNPDVVLGASKWIDIVKYTCVRAAFDNLRDNGYRIVATSLNNQSVSLEDFPIDNKMAIFFGTELTGLSHEVLENADLHLKIPMYGFTQSYNISVSVAIVFYSLISRLRKGSIRYLLNEDEKLGLKLDYYRKAVNRALSIEKFKLS